MKYFLLGYLFILVFLFTPPLHAQEATDTTQLNRGQRTVTKFQERIENLQQKRQEIQQNVEEKVASRQARLDSRRQTIVNRILAHARRMLNRADNILARMDRIWAKVESRMTKFETEGKDLSGLTDLVTEVSAKRQEAVTAISSAQTALAALEGSNEPKSAVEAFRQNYKTLKDAFKAYHQAIVDVINSLKGMSAGVGQTPTPTAVL